MKTTQFRYKHHAVDVKLPAVNPEPPAMTVSDYAGNIGGVKATHGEENLLHAALNMGAVSNYGFRVPIGAPKGLPGWKELDFLFTTKAGQFVGIQVKDYTFVHHGLASQASDNADDAFIMQQLTKQGVSLRGNQVYSVDALDLATMDQAKKVVEAIIL